MKRLIWEGTYTGPANRDVGFGGRSITLRCENGPEGCIIDAEGQGRGFYFRGGETADARLEGFTITNGYVELVNECGPRGGGIHCEVSSPTIRNCVITGNTAYSLCAAYGGGISLEKSNATISNCIIADNVAVNGSGGGIHCLDSNPAIIDSVVTGNTTRSGGGIYWNVTSGGGYLGYCPVIRNCTIVDNNADDRGGGVHAGWSGETTISNSIIGGNTASLSSQVSDSGNVTISYSDVQGGWPGVGNMNTDPLLLDGYHLAEGSACIDTGDPTFDGEGVFDIDGGLRVLDGDGNGQAVVDMGADEFGSITVRPPDVEPGGPACSGPGDCTGAHAGADCVARTCYIPKNRYLSIDPTNLEPVAYQIELADSSDYPSAVGRTWWVDTPVCYDYPNGDPVLPTPSTCEGDDRFGWVSKLTSTPVTREWTEVPLHLTDCSIVPNVVYEIRASIDEGGSYSNPLPIGTAHDPDGEAQSWGDITGGPVPGMPGLWLAPDGTTNLADVQNSIRTFENRSEDTGFPPRVWVDVEIDHVINLADVQFIVNAFEGKAYADIDDLPLIGWHPADCP